jgi:tripartite-type tricarboxylate transporter receptor subunit TctC
MINRKATIAAAFFVSLVAAPASADDFPNRPIKLIQPSTAGGFSDTLSRIIANGLSPRLGHSVVVENRSGAMNMLANKLVSRADSDGYTMLWGSIDMTVQPVRLSTA